MTDRNAKLLNTLKKDYPDAGCELNFDTPFQLLVAVVLSAQCTDKRVNIVTDELFKVAKTPSDFQKMPLETLEKLIYSTGFYHNKAVAIKSLSDDIVERFGGKCLKTLTISKAFAESETKRQASLPASLWAATLCPSIPTFSGSRTGSGCRTEKLPTP